jgi:RNA ligase (TIGR02306 family)
MEESLPPHESTRKLASIQEVTELRCHPDPLVVNLELATILGWQVVTTKNLLKEGQRIVFCEVDSLLPSDAAWLPEPVKKRIPKTKNITKNTKQFFHIKTVQFRGEISQGLIVSDLPPTPANGSWEIGDDVTDLLGIEKYESRAFTGLTFNANASFSGIPFPSDVISKTDEGRIQSNPKLLAQLQKQPYYVSVKLDGTSATYLIHPTTKDFCVCSRNLIRKLPEQQPERCPYFSIALTGKLEEKLRSYPHIALQGEICGPGLANNPLGLKTLQFFVFNVVDISRQVRLPLSELQAICEKMELETVPIEEVSDSFNYEQIGQLLERAKGTYHLTHNAREGLVYRSWNQKTSFKVINNDYLLKKKTKNKN